jgi:hypothetical protein
VVAQDQARFDTLSKYHLQGMPLDMDYGNHTFKVASFGSVSLFAHHCPTLRNLCVRAISPPAAPRTERVNLSLRVRD